MPKGNETFRKVLEGVNNRTPSKDELVEDAKRKVQTKATVDRATAQGEKTRQALKSMDRRQR